jgi:uncharacterized tellurite resistance protein B-like protein
MPAILFGAEPTPVRVEAGEFDCPECLQRRPYQRTLVRRSVRFLGAAFPAGRYGEYIECRVCLSTFRPEVLAYDAGDRTPAVAAEYQAALLRILALLVAADGKVRDEELRTVQRIFEGVTGKRLSREEVRAEVEVAGREPTTAARFLARVMGYLNEYGKEQILRGAALVSCCDGELHDREAEVVRRFGSVLRLPAERVAALLRAGGRSRTADSGAGSLR